MTGNGRARRGVEGGRCLGRGGCSGKTGRHRRSGQCDIVHVPVAAPRVALGPGEARSARAAGRAGWGGRLRGDVAGRQGGSPSLPLPE